MLNEFQKQKMLHLYKVIDFDNNGVLQKSDLIGFAENIDIFANLLNSDDYKDSLKSDVNTIWKSIASFFGDSEIDMIDKKQWLDYMDNHFGETDDMEIDSKIKKIVNRVREIYDLNSDQKLSKKEFMTLFVSMRVEVRHALECFNEIDKNGDGFISDDELTDATKQFFSGNKQEDSGNKLFGLIGTSHFSTKDYQLFGQG